MKKYIPWGLMLLAVVCIGIGVASGDVAAVLQKAAQLCLECVGIG